MDRRCEAKDREPARRQTPPGSRLGRRGTAEPFSLEERRRPRADAARAANICDAEWRGSTVHLRVPNRPLATGWAKAFALASSTPNVYPRCGQSTANTGSLGQSINSGKHRRDEAIANGRKRDSSPKRVPGWAVEEHVSELGCSADPEVRNSKMVAGRHFLLVVAGRSDDRPLIRPQVSKGVGAAASSKTDPGGFQWQPNTTLS
jgi:hypothetical protein